MFFSRAWLNDITKATGRAPRRTKNAYMYMHMHHKLLTLSIPQRESIAQQGDTVAHTGSWGAR